MNKKLLSLLFIGILGVTSASLISCGQTPISNSTPGQTNSSFNPDEEPYVASLDLISGPTKTNYNEGELFNPSGMTLKATWSHVDEETGEHIVEELGGYDVTYSKDPLEANMTSIEFFYEGKSVSVPITVKSVVVESLNVTVKPNMVAFTVDDKFTLEGMVLQASLEGGGVLTVLTGYTVTIDGKDVTAQVTGNGLTLEEGTYEVVITYKGKSTSFTINVYDGIAYKVEAEKLLGSSKYPVISETDRYYVEPNAAMQFDPSHESVYIISKDGEPASGNAYLGEMKSEGKGFTLHVWSEFTEKAVVSMCASSGVIETHALNEAWIPTSMKDIQLNQMIKVIANGNPITITDEVILPGGDISDVGEGNNGLLWVNWQSVNLGELDLVQGDNEIYVEIIATMKHGGSNTEYGSINLDYFDVIIENN